MILISPTVFKNTVKNDFFVLFTRFLYVVFRAVENMKKTRRKVLSTCKKYFYFQKRSVMTVRGNVLGGRNHNE